MRIATLALLSLLVLGAVTVAAPEAAACSEPPQSILCPPGSVPWPGSSTHSCHRPPYQCAALW